MKKNIYLLIAFTFLLYVFGLSQKPHNRVLKSKMNLNLMQIADPIRYQKFSQNIIKNQQFISSNNNSQAKLINQNGEIIIPVVFHIIHYSFDLLGSESNIPDAQIFSQIDVLNEDFNRLNVDKINAPSVFAAVGGTSKIRFQLACKDPHGNSTNGIVRINSDVGPFFYNSIPNPNYPGYYINDEVGMGIKYTISGGDDAWDTKQYLNIWVCDYWDDYDYGYATYASDYQDYPDVDGLVLDYGAVGRINPNSNLLGRSATRLLAHWFDIFDINGGANCGDDYISDTPQQFEQNYNCPTFPHFSNCPNNGANGDMFMNFMDFTDDNCKNMFTKEQCLWMRAVFQPGYSRETFIDNYFNIKAKTISTGCNVKYSVNNPLCLPVTWTISGPATISNVNGDFTTIYPNGFGTIKATASVQNYIDSRQVSVEDLTSSLKVVGSNTICTSPKIYKISNLPSTANVAWNVNPTGIVNVIQLGNDLKVLPVNNGNIEIDANISNFCYTPSFAISKFNIQVGKHAAPTILAMQHSRPNTPTIWFFEAPQYNDPVTYKWYSKLGSNPAKLVTPDINQPNQLTLLIPCNTYLGVYCTITNACGTSDPSLPASYGPGYCKPTKGGIITFPIDQPIEAPSHLRVNVATSSSELFGHLFYDKENLADEMIQGVNVYNKQGELVMQTGDLNTKSTQLDFINMPDGTYFIEVIGKNDFRELNTFYYSHLNQEEYILDNIANGTIPINTDRAADRLYVMQQKLFTDLQADAEAMNASTTLQHFASDNADGSFGKIWLIQNALGRDEINNAANLLEEWQTTNAIDNNFKNYYLSYIKTIHEVTLDNAELETLHQIALGCPLTDGEIVYAARDLYNYLVPTNTDDYSNACSSIGLSKQKPINATTWENVSKTNIIYPNPSKGSITINNMDYGIKKITITDIYGKTVTTYSTQSKTINVELIVQRGVYLVQIANAKNNKTQTQKLIIQ